MKRLLNISLIPKSTWYDNVRSRVSRDKWNAIRAYFMKRSCQYCGYKGKLFCHEVWTYDDVNHVQILLGFETMCFLCHSVHHLGLAGVMARCGDLDMNVLIKHYCDVNGCTEEDFKQDRREAFELWQERSQCVWTLDLSYLDGLVLSKCVSNYETKREKTREYMRAHPEEVERIKEKHET